MSKVDIGASLETIFDHRLNDIMSILTPGQAALLRKVFLSTLYSSLDYAGLVLPVILAHL